MTNFGVLNLFQSLGGIASNELNEDGVDLSNLLKNKPSSGSGTEISFSNLLSLADIDPQLLQQLDDLSEAELSDLNVLLAAEGSDASGNLLPLSAEQLKTFLEQLSQNTDTNISSDLSLPNNTQQNLLQAPLVNKDSVAGEGDTKVLNDAVLRPYEGVAREVKGDDRFFRPITPIVEQSQRKTHSAELRLGDNVTDPVDKQGKQKLNITNNHASDPILDSKKTEKLSSLGVVTLSDVKEDKANSSSKIEKQFIFENTQKGVKDGLELDKAMENKDWFKLSKSLKGKSVMESGQSKTTGSDQVLSLQKGQLFDGRIGSGSVGHSNIEQSQAIHSTITPTVNRTELVDKTHTNPTQQLQPNSEFTQGLNLKREFAPNLAMRIQWMFNQALKGAEILMDPPEMGPLSVKVQQINGETNILFHVSNPQTKDALDENLPRLKEMLLEQGINLGDAQVNQQKGNQQESSQQHANDSNESEFAESSMETVQVIESDRVVDVYS